MGLTERLIAIKDAPDAGAFVRSTRAVSALAPPGWSVFKEGFIGRWVEDVEKELDRQLRGVPFWCAWVEDSDYVYIFGGKGGVDWRFVYNEDSAAEYHDGWWALQSAAAHADTAENIDDIARRIAEWSRDAPCSLTQAEVRHRLGGGGYVPGLPRLPADDFFQYIWDDFGFPYPT